MSGQKYQNMHRALDETVLGIERGVPLRSVTKANIMLQSIAHALIDISETLAKIEAQGRAGKKAD